MTMIEPHPNPSRARRRENFWVLSPLLPKGLRRDFEVVYAFCRAADDVADEHDHTPTARASASAELQAWRDELRAGSPRFAELQAVIDRQGLTPDPFCELLDAFCQDQTTIDFETWDELEHYCKRSADPVGRIVLALGGINEPSDDQKSMSDAICTSLQIVNHVQDLRRDVLSRERSYLPSSLTGHDRAAWEGVCVGAPVPDRVATALEPVLDRVGQLVEHGRGLPAAVKRASDLAPVISLFHGAAESLLATIQRDPGRVAWARPSVGAPQKLAMLARSIAPSIVGPIPGLRGKRSA